MLNANKYVHVQSDIFFKDYHFACYENVPDNLAWICGIFYSYRARNQKVRVQRKLKKQSVLLAIPIVTT